MTSFTTKFLGDVDCGRSLQRGVRAFALVALLVGCSSGSGTTPDAGAGGAGGKTGGGGKGGAAQGGAAGSTAGTTGAGGSGGVIATGGSRQAQAALPARAALQARPARAELAGAGGKAGAGGTAGAGGKAGAGGAAGQRRRGGGRRCGRRDRRGGCGDARPPTPAARVWTCPEWACRPGLWPRGAASSPPMTARTDRPSTPALPFLRSESSTETSRPSGSRAPTGRGSP